MHAPHPTFAEPDVSAHRDADGCLVLRSRMPLGAHPPSMLAAFRDGARRHPDRLLLAHREGGRWRRTTWAQARASADALAQHLLDRGAGDRPVMVLSGNGPVHLVATLAAWTLGVPVAPTSVAYSLQSSDHVKLRAMAELVDPAVVVTDDADAFAPALAAVGGGRELLAGLDDWSAALATDVRPEVERRAETVGPGTVAKLLFTSGSTGVPKAVVNTHGMLTANQQMMRQVWPFLGHEPPVLLDWLPWSHTFGGNHDLGMVLSRGGSMWVDDGRPAPGLLERTLANLRDVQPTLFFNVPAGYAALVPALERDPDTAELFFRRLRLAFFAAAALPQQLWDRLEALAARHGSSVRMTTSWGLTESSPAATTTHYAVDRSDTLGVPLPGVELRLVPVGTKTEVRMRGPHVTPGYWRRPDLTAAARDDQGWWRTGDAVALVDAENPERGLLFRGRIAEDFKLSTGTFVSVGTLLPALLSAAQGLLSDAVLCGHDGEDVTALAWLHPDHAARHDDTGPQPALRAELEAALARLAERGGGSSQRVERLLLLGAPPALDAGEITDKGYVNQAAVRERRAREVALLTEPCPPAVVRRPSTSPSAPLVPRPSTVATSSLAPSAPIS